MTPLATVRYEDAPRGKEYPLHNLLLRLVEDEIGGETWRIRKHVQGNPRKGVDNVLHDIRAASIIAGGGMLFALVDRDEIVAHFNRFARGTLRRDASETEIAAALKAISDAPDRVEVYFLRPNLEGLIVAIEHCAPGQWSAEVAAAKRKRVIDRDILLGEVAKAAMRAVRDCVRSQQPGLDALARAVGALVSRSTSPPA